MCQHRARIREVGSGFVIGQDSDLLLRMHGKHVIQAEVHTCAKCRFSGYGADFLRTFSPGGQRRFLQEVSPLLVDDIPSAATASSGGKSGAAGKPAANLGGKISTPSYRTPLPHVQYQWASQTAEAVGLPATPQGERWVRAYWCLRLPPSASLPFGTRKALGKIYLKGAIQKLRQGLRLDEDPNRLYLIGELCRRNENYLLAISYFRRFLEREDGARYLKHAARKLSQAAREQSSEGMTMEQVLYKDAQDANNWQERDGGEGKGEL
jgi:hypothetical protein